MSITDKLRNQIDVLSELRDNYVDYLVDVMVDREEELLDRQRDQLSSGLDSEGNYLEPSYSDDLQPRGYFRDTSAAQRYAQWKASINAPAVYSQKPRPTDIPNLYINGRFYDELAIDITDSIIKFRGGTFYAENIIAKYGLDKFGLTTEAWREFMENGVLEDIVEKIREKL